MADATSDPFSIPSIPLEMWVTVCTISYVMLMDITRAVWGLETIAAASLREERKAVAK